MSDPKRVTLNDVAAASGVSRATASFVLRDSPAQSISAATRERVRQAARDLGYVPHGIARALREGSSRIVVLRLDMALDGHYARSYVRGLDEELAARDHALLVRYEHGPPRTRGLDSPARGLASFARGAASPHGGLPPPIPPGRPPYPPGPPYPPAAPPFPPGAGATLDAVAPRAVLRFGEPYLTGHELDDSGGGWRDGLAAHVSAQIGYLAGRGHTRIALALPGRDTPLRGVRQRFANQAAEMLGLPALTPISIPSFRTKAADSLSQFRTANPAVTSVAAFDDDVALRILAAMRDLGLTAPDDLAVIGFDDNGYGALTTPALTTVHIDAEAHGRKAARAILGLDASDLSPAPGQVVIRESA